MIGLPPATRVYLAGPMSGIEALNFRSSIA